MASSPYARDPDYGQPPRWSKEYGQHFPANTDACSRHTRIIAHDILRAVRSPVRRMLIDAGYEPDHWASSLEHTVIALWEARAKIKELEARMTLPSNQQYRNRVMASEQLWQRLGVWADNRRTCGQHGFADDIDEAARTLKQYRDALQQIITNDTSSSATHVARKALSPSIGDRS